MEFIRNVISSIKQEREIARWKKEQERKRRALEKFFSTDIGKNHLRRILQQVGIENFHQREILVVDNENTEFRLALNIGNEAFRKFIRSQAPQLINYRITHQDDHADYGDLLVVIDDKVAVETNGIIFPQTDATSSVLNGIEGVSYIRGQVEDYSNPWDWRPLVRGKPSNS